MKIEPDRIETVYDFYDKLVKNSCADYLKNHTGSLVASVNACMAIYHLTDWYVKSVSCDKKSFLDGVKVKCPEIDIARRLINAAKHGNDTKYDDVIFERTTEFVTDPYHDTEFPVHYVAAHINEDIYDVRTIVEAGLAFWEQKIKNLPSEKDRHPEKFDDSIESGDW